MRYLTAIALVPGTVLILGGQGLYAAHAEERLIDPYPLSDAAAPDIAPQHEVSSQTLEKSKEKKPLKIILLPSKEDREASRAQAAREALEAVFVPETQAQALSSSVPAAGYEGSWEAPVGADLSQTLAAWSEEGGADLVWDTQERFILREPLQIKGPYENAVQAALDQYRNDALRPVARLHVDETTGERVLVVRVSGQRF
ncbi:MAG: TcpQ domain-containing protein [Alphaproteobacteria bacterium]|nr:TcpQ domain-containing protein [Alphaproteobacteria bacterium]